MPDALDPLPLLRAMHERGVAHIIVGGFAVNAHGFIRVTKDLDIVPSSGQSNLGRLAEMLRDLDASVLETDDFTAEGLPADPTRTSDLGMGGNFCLLTELGRLDVMQWLAGIETDDLYSALNPDAVEGSLDGIPVRVCSLEHLRAMKRAAG
jgi:hypothetical protein